MSTSFPVFVVVGNVNQGKSSVVAALSEDATVPIDSYPGTTVQCAEYTFRAGERVLFRLIDTPGFQEARQALSWMRERSHSAADHVATVAAFVREHAEMPRFQDEVKLLRPLLEGAGILYVVDASSRFQPSHEAEMEILRWTGQPAMALLNRTRDRDHAAEWRPILEQFFNIVREFNAHHANFQDRMNLLGSFRELREDWRAAVDDSVAEMERAWALRRRQAASVIAELMVSALGHVARKRLHDDVPPPGLKEELERGFKEEQRRLENRARREIERIYRHDRVERREQHLEILDADLFSETSWRLFGLTRTQLAIYGSAWGAAIGGAVDLMVGGLSFFAGVAIGAAAGGLAGFAGGTRIARTWGSRSRLFKTLFPGESGRYLCIGPVTSPRYAWILLDRALVHFRAIRDRSHARQDALVVVSSEATTGGEGRAGVVATLRPAVRDQVDELLRRILRQALKGGVRSEVRDDLASLLDEVLRA